MARSLFINFHRDIELLLRLVGILVWLLICVEYIVATLPPPPGTPLRLFAVEQTIILSLLVMFAICYWRNMRDIPAEKTNHSTFFLLLLQLVPMLFVSQDLAYIVAFESALVLPQRRAIQWVTCQTVLLVCLFFLSVKYGEVKSSVSLLGCNSDVTSGVTILSILTWQLFAFCGGWFAAGEARSRHEMERLHAELILAQRGLAEQSRIEERLYISRELHDSIGHHLVALGLQLDLSQRVREADRSGHIATAATVARRMLSEVRQVVAALRQEQKIDLYRELSALQSSIPRPAIHLAFSDGRLAFDPEQSVVLLRVVQEAVSNSVRHARAGNIWISIRRSEEELVLGIRDDGCGTQVVRPGNGLTGMHERLKSIGGSLVADSAPNRGFVLKIRVPVRKTS
jgi:signal transduction histidine kinase